jgi:SAM-dependent methyltransferase
VSLASEYRRQFGWRSWPLVFEALPPLSGRTILDLGCGVGDLAAELVSRGARVIGVDGNEDLLREAASRKLPNAEFRVGDLRALADPGVPVDGLWCSFAAAYFPDLPAALGAWTRRLRPGGWVALTEIDDLFGHEPLSAGGKALFEGYARDALIANRYDFHMGRKLRKHLERSGFTVRKTLVLDDREFSFRGPADPDVLEGWRTRLDRMNLLAEFCGPRFEQLREEFLRCLVHTDHRSVATVQCCIATR